MLVALPRARVDRVADGAQPRRSASSTEPVIAEHGRSIFASESLLLSFRMSGISPAYLSATASRKPSGAA
jgi:hypothetical protein